MSTSLRKQLEALAATTATVDQEVDLAEAEDDAVQAQESAVWRAKMKGKGPPAPPTAAPQRKTALRAAADAAAMSEALDADPRYAGKKVPTNRVRQLQGRFEEEDEATGEDDDDDEEEDGDGDSDDDEEEAAEVDAGVGRLGRGGVAAHASGVADDLDAQLYALESLEAAAMLQARRSENEDAAKGMALKRQLKVYESLLEGRIRLQGPFSSAGRLPWPAARDSLCAAAPTLAPAYAALRNELAGAVCDLLRLQAAMAAHNAGVSSALPPSVVAGVKRKRGVEGVEGVEGGAVAGRVMEVLLGDGVLPPLSKRWRREASHEQKVEEEGDDASFHATPASAVAVGHGQHCVDTDALWRVASGMWHAFASYRTETLNKWGRKLAFASGLTAKRAMKLKVLNADLSDQVAEQLADLPALVARTRPAWTTGEGKRVLGMRPPAPTSAAGDGGAGAGDVNEEAYDDRDFYEATLREYIAAATAAGDGEALARQGVVAPKHKRVVRSGVDVKASKGRRLKFVTHPKLVNFVAPVPYVVPPDMAYDVDTLVASLWKA